MRKRAVLTFTILLGAFWAAGVSPAAGQVPPGPPPHVEVPKDKKPKPEKPGKPDAPEEPSLSTSCLEWSRASARAAL